MVGMEAAAISAAVSGTLKLVCNKLAPLVSKEYNSIVGVKKDLLDLQLLAHGINNRLGDRGLGDDQLLGKLKQAAEDVDDIVDEFKLKAEKYEADGDGGFVSRYLHTKPKSFVFQCKAARKIKKIKKTFDDIVKQSAVLNSLPCHGPVSNINMTTLNNQSLPFVDVPSVIGRDQEMHQTISKLLETDDQQRINIVSIVGLGGSGKTTLAQLVFNDEETIKNHFTLRLWVHVSQEFHVEKILKKLFDAIPDEKSEGLSLKNMADKISDKLTNNRFLLVLDDVWIEDRIKWEEFMVLVKNGSPRTKGSKILLTTRSKKVAKTVESTTIDLPSLSEDCSWQIFQQSFGNAVNDLDHEFQEVGKEIVNKCGGVPLAIKVLAGVLREKERVEQWHAIKKSNLLNVEGEECQVSACLRLSYFNMPSHLKQCFTMCSIFPKGHLIDKEQLIDQWIALDMIPEDRVNYLEYITGNDYFNHLVQMCFIQDVEDAENGRVKCKLHDLVHDLARSIVGDEISHVVPKKATDFTKPCRYFSVMEHTRHLPPKNTFKKARAMYIGEDDDFIFGKASKKAKHLHSITVQYVHTSALTAILQTKNLRYLNISELEHETLPEVISDIWCLQALHVRSSYLVKLPESICKLQKLRVVNLSNCWNLTSLPDSIGNCAMISCIDLFSCRKVAALPSSIGRNQRLRVLKLGCTRLKRLPSSITTLENLECLDLRLCFELVELPEGIGNLKELVVLNLQGCEKLRAIPKGIAQLTRLKTLGLFVMGEDDENYAQISALENINKISGELTICGIADGMDPDVAHMEWLKQKTNLQSLTLDCASDVGVNSESRLEGLEPPPGIKNLKIVRYSGQESTQWMFRFQLLCELELSDFPKLGRLEGLTELPCLEKLVLKQMIALKSISGGPFRSLCELSMDGMPSLGVVWMATEGSLADVEGGQLQIGNRLSVLRISKCPKLMVMPYFPLSLKELRLVQSNLQLLGLQRIGQGSSLPSSSAGLPPFSFSHLKYLELKNMPPIARATSYGSGCRWELLQHLTALEFLGFDNCSDNLLTMLPEGMRSLTSLRALSISSRSALCMLPEWLGELCYLGMMDISGCGSLSLAPSMQPLRALKALLISKGGWGLGSDCGGSLPHSFWQLTSLTRLEIISCNFYQLPECLGELRSLKMLRIHGLDWLESLPQSLGYLTSLQELRIEYCEELDQIPDCVGELRSLRIFNISRLPKLWCLPQSLGYLTSLQELRIEYCEELDQIPDCVGELRSLGVFRICDLQYLTCLPQSLGELCSLSKLEICGLSGLTSFPKSLCCLTSLEQLTIWDCPGIKSLPEWIKGLAALQTLEISYCPDLKRRCERRKGKDWHLISHIPHLRIG